MTGQSPLIEIRNLTRTYHIGRTALHALNNVSLTIHQGEYVAVVGTSGSGKSTLLNILGLLDRPTEGTYRIRQQDAVDLTDRQRTTLRNREIGFVFQEFNLLARATAQRQAELPLFYAGISPKESRRRALEALTQVGLADRANHRPEELSGGQRQRVAIARALVNRPSLLLADEPTGAIDTQTGEEVMTLFEQRHLEGLTLLIVTHDREIASRARRIITLRDGAVISDERRSAPAVAPSSKHLE